MNHNLKKLQAVLSEQRHPGADIVKAVLGQKVGTLVRPGDEETLIESSAS